MVVVLVFVVCCVFWFGVVSRVVCVVVVMRVGCWACGVYCVCCCVVFCVVVVWCVLSFLCCVVLRFVALRSVPFRVVPCAFVGGALVL